MLVYKNVMLICSRRHSRAFLTDIMQAKATAIREDYFQQRYAFVPIRKPGPILQLQTGGKSS